MKPRDTRPISISSAAERLFSRMVLNRCKGKLRLTKAWQCAGPHRQTADYLHAVYRLMEVEREWGRGLSVLKVDVAKAFDTVRRDKLMAKLTEVLGPCEELRVWHTLLSNTSTTLSSPWGDSSFATRRGIRQGAIESPCFFACIVEWMLLEAAERYSWSPSVSTYEGLDLTQLAFMDDCLLWDGTSVQVMTKLQQFQVILSEWGLEVNLAKCSLYVSPKHHGPDKITISGVTIAAQDTLSVMGVEFKVGHNVKDMLQGTWNKAKAKFWSLRHLLRAKTPIRGRMKLLDRVIGNAALWNSCAFYPEYNAMESLNQLMYQFTIWMMWVGKRSHETWEEYRRRSTRQARAVVHQHLGLRWSTKWAERFWMYMGHVARGVDSVPPLASSVMNAFRDHEWWQQEQHNPFGKRHNGRFCAKLGPYDAKMNAIAGQPWRIGARDRVGWKGFCASWVAKLDVPWNSRAQFAIMG